MALLGTLQVRLGLDSGTFSKGLSKFSRDAKSQTAGISKGFSNLIPTKALLGGLASLASGLSAISFANMIRGSNDAIDAMGEVAGRLGIATSKLQEYRTAAKFAGVESEGLDKSLGFLARNLGNIRNGLDTGGKKVGILESLGLSSAEIQGADISTVFEKVVDGLSKIEDPATRSATAISLFGKSAGELGLLFAEGAPALERSRQLIRDLGLEINDLDAERAGQLNDNFDKLGLVLQGVKNRLAVELAPALIDVTNRFFDAGTAGQNMGQQIASAANVLGQLVNAALAVGNTLSAAFNLMKAGFAGISAAVLGFASDFVTAIGTTAPNAFNSLLEATESGLTKMKQGFADFATAAANVVVAGMNKAIEAVDTLVNGAAAGISKFLELANQVPGVNLGTFSYSQTSEKASAFSRFPVDRVDLGRVGTFGGGLAGGLGSYSEGFGIEAKNQLADAGTDIRQAFQAGEAVFNPAQSADLAAGLKEATTYANELTGALGGSGAGGASGGGGAKGAVEDLGDQFKETTDAIKYHGLEVQNVWNNSMQSIGSAIDEVVKTGKLDFKSLVDSIIADIASAALKNAISSAFSAILGTKSDGSTGQGNAQNYFNFLGSLFQTVGSFEGGGYTGSGPRTGGMDGRGGRLAMVHPNETVIDHEKVRGAARTRRRGDAVNLTVPITLMPGVSKQELAEILPLVKRDIIQTIPNLISRGGRYAAAYGQ